MVLNTCTYVAMSELFSRRSVLFKQNSCECQELKLLSVQTFKSQVKYIKIIFFSYKKDYYNAVTA